MNAQEFLPRQIRWIGFDAVGTLIRPEPSVGEIYHRIGAKHGSRLTRDEIASRFREVFARLANSDELTCGCGDAGQGGHTCEVREKQRWQTIVREVLDDVPGPDACFDELFAHFGRPQAWVCFPDVGPALSRLRQAGFRLAIASNFDSRLHPVMTRMPELKPVELCVVSSEVKARKPSARFFEALVAAAGCAASEILFVGDDPVNDVAAAKAAGLWALQIDRSHASVQNRALRSLDELVTRLI
jgi:putative hydrolase of the HAD superfamily